MAIFLFTFEGSRHSKQISTAAIVWPPKYHYGHGSLQDDWLTKHSINHTRFKVKVHVTSYLPQNVNFILGALLSFLWKFSPTKTTSYMVGQHATQSLLIISLIKVWAGLILVREAHNYTHTWEQTVTPDAHQWLLRSFSWMMMTASLWLTEMLTPSGCTLFTTKLIVKFSAGSGSLSSTITILKQPVLFLNKTVALTISKSFSAPVSEIKRTESWNHKATSKH